MDHEDREPSEKGKVQVQIYGFFARNIETVGDKGIARGKGFNFLPFTANFY
jgi:hypothetical protein